MSRGRRRLPRTTAAVLGAVGLTLVLTTGCGAQNPDLADSAAAQLQAQVLSVSTASAAGDLPAARTALDALGSAVAAAADTGELSAERRGAIESSIAAVAADLTALEAEAARASAEQAAAEQAAAEAAARAAAEDDADESPNPSRKPKNDPKDKDD